MELSTHRFSPLSKSMLNVHTRTLYVSSRIRQMYKVAVWHIFFSRFQCGLFILTIHLKRIMNPELDLM